MWHRVDDDAASLFAESLMNTMPWDYWIDADNPKPLTIEAIDTLEKVLERNPSPVIVNFCILNLYCSQLSMILFSGSIKTPGFIIPLGSTLDFAEVKISLNKSGL